MRSPNQVAVFLTAPTYPHTRNALRLLAALTGKPQVQILERLVADELRRVREQERKANEERREAISDEHTGS